VDRVAALVRPLGEDVTIPAYPSEWTVADVMSHLGSGAVILGERLDRALANEEADDNFNREVWATWNAKSPRAKVDDAVVVDDGVTRRLEHLPADDRRRLVLPLGPMRLNWDQAVGLRLNEHVLHEWDVAVALDPRSTLPADGVASVIDNLAFVARFTARPGGPARTITIRTSDPDREFTVTVEAGAVRFEPSPSSGVATAETTLTMPAEAFIRLVYGRLDPEHTPSTVQGDEGALDQLRGVFPGP
jgi:uncharacterized protein (TIGR03083 family)